MPEALSMNAVEKRLGLLPLKGRYHRPPQKLEDDYEVQNINLGRGCSGTVKMAVSKYLKNQRFAVKTLTLAGLSPKKLEALQSEVQVSLCVDHPHVARLVDVYESGETMHLVMECLEGGELFQRVKSVRWFGEQEAANTTHQILLALNYIHSSGIVHRDLKLENLCYDAEGSNHLKLIDFGFSKFRGNDERLQTRCGSLRYVAPEVLEGLYTSKCDMWSLGVIVFILLSGKMPFTQDAVTDAKSASAQLQRAMSARIWNNISRSACSFVRALLEGDPSDRLTAQAALAHPWLSGRNTSTKLAFDTNIMLAFRSYSAGSCFRRSCLSMVAWLLSNEDHARVRQYFIDLDGNKDGTINLEDLSKVLVEEHKLSKAEVGKIFQALDSNSDKLIHYSDFLAAMLSTLIPVNDALLHLAFQKFDLDHSGYITEENLAHFLGTRSLQGKGLRSLIAEADEDRDGVISYADFKNFIKPSKAPIEDVFWEYPFHSEDIAESGKALKSLEVIHVHLPKCYDSQEENDVNAPKCCIVQ